MIDDIEIPQEDLVGYSREFVNIAPEIIEDFNRFKEAVKSSEEKEDDLLYCMFTCFSLVLSVPHRVNAVLDELYGEVMGEVDDLDTRLSFMEKDMKMIKKFFKRCSKRK